jgi:hypothetical protein
MRGIALLTTLAMSAGTVAFAAPGRVADRDDVRVQVRTHDNDPNGQWSRDRYDRYNTSHWSRDFRGRWRTLASGFSAQSQRQFINTNGQRLSKLRIEGVRGAPVIQKIAIEFGDGTTQAVDLDMRLSRGTGEVIDLNGATRRVNRIIVYSDARTRGSYSLYGA